MILHMKECKAIEAMCEVCLHKTRMHMIPGTLHIHEMTIICAVCLRCGGHNIVKISFDLEDLE